MLQAHPGLLERSAAEALSALEQLTHATSSHPTPHFPLAALGRRSPPTFGGLLSIPPWERCGPWLPRMPPGRRPKRKRLQNVSHFTAGHRWRHGSGIARWCSTKVCGKATTTTRWCSSSMMARRGAGCV
jgi:hypothetical protein